MKNHKWKAEKENTYGTKPHTCVVCGVSKTWYGGDYQCWHYYWFDPPLKCHDGSYYSQMQESFNRPNCKKP